MSYYLTCVKCGSNVLFIFKNGSLHCDECKSELGHHSVTVHRDDDIIGPFVGQFFVYSNFYMHPVTFGGLTYKSNEHAFQAAKTLHVGQREQIAYLPYPGDAKKYGRRLSLREDWEDVKFTVMEMLIRQKFSDKSYSVMKQLVDTGDRHMEEINTWSDRVWGTVNGKGENNLGKTLMKIRLELKLNK